LIDKGLSIYHGIELQIILIWIQTHYCRKDLLCLIWISILIKHRIDCNLFSFLILIVYIEISILLSINWIELLLAKSCIIWVLHQFVMSSLIQKLLISLRILERFLRKLRSLVWVHKSIEMILIGKVPKSVLLIFTLHLMNLSFQICNFFLAILLLIISILRGLTIISRLRLPFWNSIFFGVFGFRKMLWKSFKKFIVFSIIIASVLCSSSTKLFIRWVVTFTEKSMIRLQCWKNNQKPFNIWLMSACHVQLKRSLYSF